MSIFYTQRFQRRFPISLLAFERFSALIKEIDPVDAVRVTLADCCGLHSPASEDLEYFVARVEALQQPVEPTAPPATAAAKRSLGTTYFKTIQEMSVDALLLMACGYDMARARTLYCEVDREDVMALLESFVQTRAEEFNYLFECVMYGFGGGYSEDKGSPAPEDTIDLSKGDALEQLNQLFGR